MRGGDPWGDGAGRFGASRVCQVELNGRRPLRPETCGDETWAVLQAAWNLLPKMRPTAQELLERLVLGP